MLLVPTPSRSLSFAGLVVAALAASAVTGSARQAPSAVQTEASTQAPSFEQLKAAIDKLGAFDYAERAAASRLVRRAPAAQAVAVLSQAVSEHVDGFVRFRALVLLTGFPDPRVRDLMLQSLADPNDRLRQLAYRYFEHHPDPRMAADLVAALAREQAQFVRPALLRALAALGRDDERVRRALVQEIGRGETLFRSAVIEALGDYRATYALDALSGASGLEGPLQQDAALALGKLQDRRALPVLAKLQQSAPPAAQPDVAAAICLLGVNCSSHLGYLERVLRFAEKTPGFQPLVRGAAAGLGSIAAAGNSEALVLLIDVGRSAVDPLRAPIALALGKAALRSPALLLEALHDAPRREAALALLGESFDMLEEDYEKERFFVFARRAFWQSPEGSPTRHVVQSLFDKLDF